MVSDVGRIICLRVELTFRNTGPCSCPFPLLCSGEKQSAEQIVVVDITRAIEIQSDETVVTHVDVLVRVVSAVVIQDAVAIGDVWNGVAVNRHAAMANAAPEGLNPLSCSKTVVESKAVFMSPEPQNGPFGRNNVSEVVRVSDTNSETGIVFVM